VAFTWGCGQPPTAVGWYPKLFYGISTESDPTIADVHTQPTDEAGNWQRMTDPESATLVYSNPPANPAWLQGIVSP
jgi:hypothetical protein